jgi:hypothetical protein
MSGILFIVAHVSTVSVVEPLVQCLGYCLDSRVKFSDAFFHGGVVRYFSWFNTYVAVAEPGTNLRRG